MELVDSVPQYAAIIKHCPDIIRAILSIQADAFDCHTLYTALSTTQCSTCERFGDHLYLIDCRRVCYFCFTRRLEYFPLTIGLASGLFTPDGTQQRGAITSRQRLLAASDSACFLAYSPHILPRVWKTKSLSGQCALAPR